MIVYNHALTRIYQCLKWKLGLLLLPDRVCNRSQQDTIVQVHARSCTIVHEHIPLWAVSHLMSSNSVDTPSKNDNLAFLFNTDLHRYGFELHQQPGSVMHSIMFYFTITCWVHHHYWMSIHILETWDDSPTLVHLTSSESETNFGWWSRTQCSRRSRY